MAFFKAHAKLELMDPESKQMLQNMQAQVEDSNQMLHAIRRSQKISSLMSVVYWLIIIGISVGAFLFLQPYVDQIMKFLKSEGVTFSQFQNLFKSIPK